MRLQRSVGTWLAALFVLTLAGCGGNNGFSEGDDDDGGVITPASITLLASSPQLSSNAEAPANGVTLTAIVKDENNNVMPDQTVVFSTEDSADITADSPTTDGNGRATAVVTTGGDPENRTISVTATSGSESAQVTVSVVGTQLSISGAATSQVNTPTQYIVSLVDAGGSGISGQTLTFTSNAGNSLSPTTGVTDGSGQVTVTLTPTVANSFLTANGLGLTATQNIAVSTDQFEILAPAANANILLNTNAQVRIRWRQGAGGTPVPDGTVINLSSTRGTFANAAPTTTAGIATTTISSSRSGAATILATSSALSQPVAQVNVEFVATRAVSLAVSADPATIATNETSDVVAVVRDGANNLVKGKTVNFSLTDSTGGTLSAPSAVSDSLGIARVTYLASSVTSAKDGVVINAVATNGDGSTAMGQTTLTVGSRALRITLGTGNEIFEPNETTYQLPYSALVTDSAGNPAPDAQFRLSVVPTQFGKGFYAEDPVTGDIVQVVTARCPNEDSDNNGIMDAGEDRNGNGVLDPGNVASVPDTLALDPDSGTVQFNVTYPQDRGNWIKVKLTARAAVAGTETTENANFLLPISEGDADNPPGSPSPYGQDGNGDVNPNDGSIDAGCSTPD